MMKRVRTSQGSPPLVPWTDTEKSGHEFSTDMEKILELELADLGSGALPTVPTVVADAVTAAGLDPQGFKRCAVAVGGWSRECIIPEGFTVVCTVGSCHGGAIYTKGPRGTRVLDVHRAWTPLAPQSENWGRIDHVGRGVF